jgi:RNA polymerase sigma-70 factor, ECF subfamily
MDEPTLITLSKQGNTRAFVQLTKNYQNFIFHYLGRMGLTQAEVEELAQDTWLRVFQHLHKYEAEQATFATWILTIARRLALNALDKAYRQFEVQDEDSMLEIAETETLTPFERIALTQRQSLIRNALKQLPPEQRSLLSMAYLQELSLEQIAQIEECALGTIKSRLFRAKSRLHALLAAFKEELI